MLHHASSVFYFAFFSEVSGKSVEPTPAGEVEITALYKSTLSNKMACFVSVIHSCFCSQHFDSSCSYHKDSLFKFLRTCYANKIFLSGLSTALRGKNFFLHAWVNVIFQWKKLSKLMLFTITQLKSWKFHGIFCAPYLCFWFFIAN